MNRNVLFIPIGILAIGILPLPIGYYTLVRIVVFITMGYLAWQYFEAKDNTLVWVFGFFAVLYNPILPIYLHSKTLWIVFNITTIAALIYQYGKTGSSK